MQELKTWTYIIKLFEPFYGTKPQTYLIQTKVNHLIVQLKFKAFLASEVVDIIPKKICSGPGQLLTLTEYSSGLP